MSDERKLIEQVTQQVLAAVRQVQGPAPIHPPAGTCAGDSSKFKDPAAPVGGFPEGTLAPATVNAQAPLTGIVTAKQLERITGSIVRLSPTARLTPLAIDLIKDRKLTIERSSAATSAPVSGGGWVWWIDGNCPLADQVTAEMRSTLISLSHRRSSQSMVEVIRDIARRAATGRVAGAVLFVPSAVRAAVMANRCQTLRAVVGTSVNAAEESVRQIAANVLIIEYPQHGANSMRAMVQAFVGAERPKLPEIERQLKELGSCA